MLVAPATLCNTFLQKKHIQQYWLLRFYNKRRICMQHSLLTRNLENSL